MAVIKVGSRKSELAMIQTNWVVDTLRKLNPKTDFEIVTMETMGDKVLDIALSKIGTKSLFTKELEVLLLGNQVDFVVHSLKDLPTTLPEKLQLGGICEREDPRDAVIFRKDLEPCTLDSLPAGSVIGTSSLRRTAQLLAKYPDLNFESVRGNLNTRLRKLDESTNDGAEGSRYSALVLAAAGVKRMKWEKRISQYLGKDECLHAVGQGSIGLECRENDEKILKLLGGISHTESTLRCLAERAFMKSLEGGCSVPLGVWTELSEGKMKMSGSVHSLDGKTSAKSELEADVNSDEEAKSAGEQLAEMLRKEGAMDILNSIPRQENINATPK
eukprot:m.341971 g.341971  ORF g.341971 m.341971 type:complete len:330 (+) comp20734_c0_seq1:205-1194(+)